MRNRILFVVPFALALLVGCQAQPAPKAKLTLLKERYLVGEPISVKLTLSNPGPEALGPLINYPAIGILPEADGLHFRIEGTGLQPRPVVSRLCEDCVLSIGFSSVSVPAWGEWSTIIYLQGYLKQPQPGRYSLPYNLELWYWKQQPQELQQDRQQESCLYTIPSGEGELVFTVEDGPPHELMEVLQGYEADLLRANSWKQERVAAHGLCVVDAPEVVPFLVRMLARSDHRRSALAALGRFRDHPVASLAVVDQAKSDDVSAVAQAVEILTEWKYVLEKDHVQKLLNSEHSTLRAAALRYVENKGRW